MSQPPVTPADHADYPTTPADHAQVARANLARIDSDGPSTINSPDDRTVPWLLATLAHALLATAPPATPEESSNDVSWRGLAALTVLCATVIVVVWLVAG